MEHPIANIEQAAAWDGAEGEAWAAEWQTYDRSIAAYQQPLFDAAAIVDGECVLDIGCGNGQTSREAARRTPSGTVLAIDLSGPMLERATELAARDGLTNIDFVKGDAQVHAFDADAFDVAIARFSAMFFADKKEGFANIARALRPGGRLVLLAWQRLDDNEQFRTVFETLAAGRPLPTPPPGAPTPFGLADEQLGRSWLDSAGFVDVSYESLRRPFNVADTADEAYRFFADSPMAAGLLRDLDDEARTAALAALHEAFDAHETAEGVVFDSAVWSITARIP